MTLFSFGKKDDERKPSAKDEALATFAGKVVGPILGYVNNHPTTIFSMGLDSRFSDYSLVLTSLLRLEHGLNAEHSVITDDQRLIGFNKPFLEGRVAIFVDNTFREMIYGALKSRLQNLDYDVLGAKYVTILSPFPANIVPQPEMHGFGPICLTKEEKSLERVLEKRYGRDVLKDFSEPDVKNWSREYASLCKMAEMMYHSALRAVKSDDPEDLKYVFDMFDQKFAQPAHRINTGIVNPTYYSPERVAFGEYTGAMWRKFQGLKEETGDQGGQPGLFRK